MATTMVTVVAMGVAVATVTMGMVVMVAMVPGMGRGLFWTVLYVLMYILCI